ncbi:leucyl/phenylalanyl-tRNA--protein transferase [Ammonicoccus fulvus]|uniref:Leucyl/phenylalanyl-tRNA--protein transferase n=1 Tax=Ammonicoccus fulvus TaxID=3138240 RepID=A0ABZ3FMJ4_9ACTN
MNLPDPSDPRTWPARDLITASIGMDPDFILRAYARGLFPMPMGYGAIGWFSPVRRGILPLDPPSDADCTQGGLRVSRSLRKTAKRYSITIDTAFDEVLDRCGDPDREHGWIDDSVRLNYGELHRRGHAHSIEARDADGRLVGGLYGIGIGGFFAGESMFHDPERGRDASKAALIALVGLLTRDGAPGRLLDVQWRTDHLATLGVIEIPRDDYLARLKRALQLPEPQWTVLD